MVLVMQKLFHSRNQFISLTVKNFRRAFPRWDLKQLDIGFESECCLLSSFSDQHQVRNLLYF